MVPILFFQLITFYLFLFGFLGIFIIKRNLIMLVICIELLLISVQFNFIIYSFSFNDIFGQIFILFILAVAAAEVAIGLAFLIVYYRLRGTLDSKYIYLTKG
jgi:NADH:ubiquinone oxidoreductase subunit K